MITSPSQHHDDDEDIDMLRKIAMESLKKRERANDFNIVDQPPQIEHQFSNFQPHYGSQPEGMNPDIPFHSNSFPSARPPRMSGNPNFMRPRFMNNFPPRHAVRPFIQNRMPPVQHQFPPQIPIRQEFVPIPHVNPQFLAQQQQPPQIVPPIFPAMDYMETPKARLSPRTLKFIEENEEAIKKASTKRYSRRSHSGSPTRRRSRSPPYKRRSPNDINRKRYRSKTPENRAYKSRNNSPKVEKRSKSPKNRSQSPRNARFARGRGRDGRDRYNGNGNGRFNNNRKRSGSDKEDERPRSKPKEEVSKVEVTEKQKEELPKVEKVIEKVKSLSPHPEEGSTTPPLSKLPEKKEKTQEELEDELLASTDEEDGDQLDINMDDNELDFLEDDSESENEGRFKSKPSSNVKTTSVPSKSSSYSSKSYDKGKYSSSRNDYKRDDKYSSRRKDVNESRKKSPERKEISLNKDKDNAKSSTESERKPMFKSTFKSIDSGEKKADSTTTKKSVTLVRSFVSKPDTVAADNKKTSSSVKSVITINEDSSKTGGKRKIMERLGEFVGAKGKIEGNRSRATKQVFERRKVMIGMKINGAVENKSMASRNTYCAI